VSRAKIEEVTLDALRTRQSLVKGERLVRHEMRAVLIQIGGPQTHQNVSSFDIGTVTRLSIVTSVFMNCFRKCSQEGFATLSSSAMPEATSGLGRSKLREPAPQRKIDVKRELPVGSVSVFTLIRTDTTLDHSQKAEKV